MAASGALQRPCNLPSLSTGAQEKKGDKKEREREIGQLAPEISAGQLYHRSWVGTCSSSPQMSWRRRKEESEWVREKGKEQRMHFRRSDPSFNRREELEREVKGLVGQRAFIILLAFSFLVCQMWRWLIVQQQQKKKAQPAGMKETEKDWKRGWEPFVCKQDFLFFPSPSLKKRGRKIHNFFPLLLLSLCHKKGNNEMAAGAKIDPNPFKWLFICNDWERRDRKKKIAIVCDGNEKKKCQWTSSWLDCINVIAILRRLWSKLIVSRAGLISKCRSTLFVTNKSKERGKIKIFHLPPPKKV